MVQTVKLCAKARHWPKSCGNLESQLKRLLTRLVTWLVTPRTTPPASPVTLTRRRLFELGEPVPAFFWPKAPSLWPRFSSSCGCCLISTRGAICMRSTVSQISSLLINMPATIYISLKTLWGVVYIYIIYHIYRDSIIARTHLTVWEIILKFKSSQRSLLSVTLDVCDYICYIYVIFRVICSLYSLYICTNYIFYCS